MAITKATASAVAPAAKGDLVVGSATNDAAVLGVGSADQVLTVDSSTTTGLKWATPSAGSMTLLSTTTLSGSSTTISNINQTYKNLFVVGTGIYGSQNTSMLIAFNSSPSNHQWKFIQSADSTITGEGLTNVTNIKMGLVTSSSGTDRTGTLIFDIYDYATSNAQKPIRWSLDNIQSNGTPITNFGTGIFSNTSAITQMVISTNAGTWSGGTIRIFGVN